MTCDILILDEINIAAAFNLIPLQEVLKLMEAKPDGMELILTGRHAPPEIIEKADLVTEMKNLKHYYEKGRPRTGSARSGKESTVGLFFSLIWFDRHSE